MSVSLTRSDWARIAIASVLALAALVVVSGLGLWQYGRAHRDDITKQVLAAAAVPVQSLVKPASYVSEFDFAREVTLSGTLNGAKTLMSCGRVNGSCILISPLELRGTLHSVAVVTDICDRARCAARLAEVRAFGPQDMDIKGRLQPAEVMVRPAAMLPATEEIAYISTNELVIRWQIPLLDGYVVKDGVDITLVTPPSGISWRNLMYAWQWWTFAAFIVFLLTRYILDVRAERQF